MKLEINFACVFTKCNLYYPLSKGSGNYKDLTKKWLNYALILLTISLCIQVVIVSNVKVPLFFLMKNKVSIQVSKCVTVEDV